MLRFKTGNSSYPKALVQTNGAQKNRHRHSARMVLQTTKASPAQAGKAFEKTLNPRAWNYGFGVAGVAGAGLGAGLGAGAEVPDEFFTG
jgi:hypothetical protein